MTTTADGVPFYSLDGGPNYSGIYFTIDPVDIAPEGSLDHKADAFSTMEDAFNAWIRRRNDWTGFFPCWGDGLELVERGKDDDVVYADYIIGFHDSSGDVVDGWTIEECLVQLNREGELHHYVDIEEEEA